MRVHPMLPLVGFCWIVAITVSIRSCGARSSNELSELTHRMCACQDRACIDEVDRDAERVIARRSKSDRWGRDDDALDSFGAEQDLLACRREALKRLR